MSFHSRSYVISSHLQPAIRGQGAFLNDKKLAVSPTSDLKNALVAIACGAEIGDAESKIFLDRLNVVISSCRTWRR